MASTSSKPELQRISSFVPCAFDYFTNSLNPTNIKSDLILIVGNEKFYCHRLLLSLVSPVFARMFDGDFKERNEQELVLEGKKSESILELLKAIYPQFQGEITNENVDDFLQLADEYMIEHLKEPCKALLIRQLEVFKYVLLPTQQKLEQPSTKPKYSPISDTASNSTPTSDDHSTSNHSNLNRHSGSSTRRPTSSTRGSTTKPSSGYLKPHDKTGVSSNVPSRYVLYLDRTKMPTFFNADNARIPFTTTETEVWLRRLRILYQIHKGHNYEEIIDLIISILQYIPSNILLPFIRLNVETYTADEMMLNDISRARMFVLEEWGSDGEAYRSICLTEAYRTMSSNILVTTTNVKLVSSMTKFDDHEQNSREATLNTTSDSEATTLLTDSDAD